MRKISAALLSIILSVSAVAGEQGSLNSKIQYRGCTFVVKNLEVMSERPKNQPDDRIVKVYFAVSPRKDFWHIQIVTPNGVCWGAQDIQLDPRYSDNTHWVATFLIPENLVEARLSEGNFYNSDWVPFAYIDTTGWEKRMTD